VSTATTSPTGQADAGRAFTKRLRWAAEFRMLALLGAIVAYGGLGPNQRVAQFVPAITSRFGLQVAIAWLPLWAVCTAIVFPVAWYSFYLQRKFGLITVGPRLWFRDYLKTNALALLYGAALIEILFLSNLLLPSFGWVCAGLLYSLLILWLTGTFPWILSLFYPVVPLGDVALRERLTQLAAKAGLRAGSIYEWRISGRTRQANAFVTGVGTARRILLTDTLISNLSPEEVEAMVAHELGHCALHHVAKRVLLQGVIFSLIFGCIDFAVRHGLVWFAGENLGWADLKLLPGFFFYWTCGRAYGSVIVAALSRRQEKEADLYSWKLTGRAESFITALRKLSDTNLIVFDKGSEWRYAHPATAERLAAAEKFARANGELPAAISATVATDSGSN
jgi:STE24 endopeptidase